jgi:hypothetical protein
MYARETLRSLGLTQNVYKPRNCNKYISHGNGNILPRFQLASKHCISKCDNEKKEF